MPEVSIISVGPGRFAEVAREVAALRIEVFRSFPYLYDGDLAYEEKYLATYARSERAVWVLARAGDRIVGASTGLPLADEEPAFQAPFEAAGWDIGRVFYFGESVLLSEYRGHGIGHGFFDHREAHARAFGAYTHTAFAAVDRAEDDPRRPPGHRDLDGFWRGRGYEKHPELRMKLGWKELGEREESDKTLTFWLRALAQ